MKIWPDFWEKPKKRPCSMPSGKMGDDIDSMLNEDEKHIEAEELKEERERSGRKKGKPARSAPLGVDEDLGIGDLEPAELEHIDHHAVERGAIEETIAPRFSPLSEKIGNKKKIPTRKHPKGKSQVKKKAGSSTRKQKERYSKE